MRRREANTEGRNERGETIARIRTAARVTYRRATVADIGTLVDHRHRMWTDIGRDTEAQIREHDPRYRRWAKQLLQRGEFFGWLAEAPDGSVVGSGCVWLRAEQPRPNIRIMISPYILSMYTVPEWRGRGIATRIVRDLVRECRSLGCPNVELHASKFGRRVYGHLGFERTWEMRFWIDPRIRRARALHHATEPRRRKKGLDRGGSLPTRTRSRRTRNRSRRLRTRGRGPGS